VYGVGEKNSIKNFKRGRGIVFSKVIKNDKVLKLIREISSMTMENQLSKKVLENKNNSEIKLTKIMVRKH
jgi:hypothetical protein